MTYWTMNDDLACDIANEVTALANPEQDQDRKAVASRYLAARVRGLDEKKANAQANANPSPKGQHQPKKGDRFIHARYLKPGAKPPYDSDDKFEVRVITRVTPTEIYHAPEDDPRIAASTYITYWDSPARSWEPHVVRRWL